MEIREKIYELEAKNADLIEKLEFHEFFIEHSSTWETFRDANGKIIYVSPSFEKIMGGNRNDYKEGKISFLDFVYKDDIELAKIHFQRQMNREAFSNFICRIIDVHKVLKYISVSSVPVYDKNKTYLGFRTSITDVTDFKHTEQKLKESEEKYKALIESTQTGYLILDSSGCVVDANNEYVGLTGNNNLSEILGKKVTEWTAPYDKVRNAKAVEECIKNGFIYNLKWIILIKIILLNPLRFTQKL